MTVLQRRFLLLVSVVLLILLPGSMVFAQGQTISYGDAQNFAISEGSPFAFFNFQGTENDLVTVQVVGVAPGFMPTISLNSPTQQQIAFSAPDPLAPGVARISAVLDASGFYTVIIGSTGAFGEFAMRIDGTPAAVLEAFPTEPLELSSSPIVIPVEGVAETAQQVTISTTPEDFAIAVALRNEANETVATAYTEAEQPAQLIVPQGEAPYTLEVHSLDPNAVGTVAVDLALLGAGAPQDAAATSTPVTTAVEGDACQATSSSNINVRSGPGTGYSVVGSLNAGSAFVILGTNSGWYAVQLPGGGVGWVFSDVVQTVGNCDGLTIYEFTGETAPPPQATEEAVTAVPTTAEQAQETNPTSTPTEAQQETQAEPTPVPTEAPPTEPPAQVAPPDSNVALVIELDSSQTLQGDVSYPDGDTEDVVSYRVTGLNSSVALPGGRGELVITVNCSGTNTDQVEVIADGRTFGCGDTVLERIVNFDSNTGAVRIRAIGGEGTYVQWTLSASVERLN